MATVPNDDSLFESEYDSDSISLTATVASDYSETALYDVEKIISEYTVQDDEGNDVVKYLTKWLNYPLHKCTWEPVEHLNGTTLLEDWDKLFEKLGKDAFDKLVHDNHAEYEAAVQYVAAAKAHRQELRARKRLKLQSTGKLVETVRTRPFIIDSNSDSDTPLMRNVGMRSGARSTRETRPRTPTAQQSSSSAVSSISSENSNDSLMEQLKTNDTEAECRKPRRKPVELIGGSRRTKDGSESLNKAEQPMRRSSKSVPNKSSDPKGQKQDESARPSSSGASRPLNSPDRSSRKGSGQLNWQPDIIVNTPTAAATRRSSNVTDNENIKVPGPLAAGLTPQLEKPTQSMRRSAPAIKMVNEPKSGPLRSAWHKGGDQAAYSKMHFRRKAELRGRNEATPDPTALSFINAPPGLMASKSTQLNDNLYARRDTTNTRPARSNDSDDEAAAPSTTQSPDWEKEKVPMTCFEWRNGSCRYGAEVCWFLHRDTAKIGPANGYIPPKYARPKITCSHWMRAKCYNSEDNCDYAHYNTGWLAGGSRGQPPVQIDPNKEPDTAELPRSFPVQQRNSLPLDTSNLEGKDLTCYFWMRHPGGCIKPETQCSYSHRNTGWLLRLKGEPGPSVVRLGHMDPPRSMKSRSDVQVSLRDAPSRGDDSDSRSIREPGRKTCFFWHQGSCKKGQNCLYAHYDTGTVADPPPGYNQRHLYSNVETSYLDSSDDVPQPASTLDSLSGSNNIAAGTTPSEQTAGIGNWNMPSTHEAPIARRVDAGPASLSCLRFLEIVEDACKLNFAEMFGDENGSTMLRPIAFLMFHPKNHAKELELITRWLHLHYVEVRSVWLEGSWGDFKQQVVGGGTGSIIVHPDFGNYSELPDFGQVLKRKVRVWSVGLQYGNEYDPDISTMDPPVRYDRIEVFPRGGIIYITDDVFEERPAEALKIFELFIAKVEQCRKVAGPTDPSKLVDDGYIPWRIATRPGLMERIWTQCVAHEKEIDAQDPVQSTRAELYALLHRTGYVEQDHSPLRARPEDYFPIMSERPEFIPEYEQALKRSQYEANTWMVQMYAGLAIDHRRHYRQYYVVHTCPTKSSWNETCQNISEVISPDRCIEYFQQSAESAEAVFDFYEWAFPKKDPVVAS